MKNKKNFELPELTIISFAKEDIIVTSGENYSPYDSEKDYWED